MTSPIPGANLQIDDDLELLNLMHADMAGALDLYKPTNNWSFFVDDSISELREKGLKDFRRSGSTAFGRFMALDNIPREATIVLSQNRWLYNRLSIKVPGWTRLLEAASRFLTDGLHIHQAYSFPPEGLWRLSFAYSLSAASKTNARSLLDIQPSLYGNPAAVFEHEGKTYPFSFLTYYMRYVYCSRWLDFGKLKRVVELGSGAGQKAELLKKCHPHLTMLLFDIPPGSYVCEQYLKKVFPGQVHSYRSTRQISSLEGLEEGKIHIFGAWQMPLLADYQHDLFISCKSLAEMEPHVVRNYLSFVNQSAANVYLAQVFSGKAEARRKGLPGVIKSTTYSDYDQALNQFTMIDRSPLNSRLGQASGEGIAEEAFWIRGR